MNKAIYPGSFDPVTFGHLDIIERCSKIYDQLIVGVIKDNNNKNFLFDEFQRKNMIENLVTKFPNVEVRVFDSLLVDFAVKEKSKIIIRGLRALSDFEYEFQMALMNRSLAPEISTLFMMPDEKYMHLNSTVVKEIAALGGDMSTYVPEVVYTALKSKLSK